MSEIEPAPTTLFDLDIVQIRAIAKGIKSRDPETLEAGSHMDDNHPSMADAIKQQARLNDILKVFGDGNEYFARGACMAYRTSEELAESLQFELPTDPGSIPKSEWAITANSLNRSGQWPRTTEDIKVRFTCVQEFQKRQAAYYETALHAIARIQQKHVDDMREMVETDKFFTDLEQQLNDAVDGVVTAHTTPLNETLAFIDGYGRVMLYFEDFHNTAQMPEL
jgi:hypothetical protein